MTDYIATGRVVPERVAAIVQGIAEACVEAGCALVGGETAEHPGLMEPDEYDVAGAATGVVEADRLLGPGRVQAGDVVVAMASSGLHSNGYSLVRHVLAQAGWGLDRHVDELGGPVGETLLTPTRIYTKPCLQLAADTRTHAMAHVTGGGLAANLQRVLPAELEAVLDRGTWTPPPVFDVVREAGGVRLEDAEQTLNQGVGMVAVVDARDADRALEVLAAAEVPAWVAGEVRAAADPASGADELAGGAVHLVGSHPAG